MDEYLDNYIRYISNFKKSISIVDTETYVSSHKFDIETISNSDESHMKLESFIRLINSRKFYKGHSTTEKIQLLIQCLEILHNYSKNLLVNFSIYSTKSIQEVTTNIRDYLAHLPYYSSYLSDSLGYEFDPAKREWFIKHKSLSKQHQLRLASTCVLCANIRVVLMDMQSNDDQRSSSPDIDEQPQSSIKSVEQSNSKWECQMCEALNAEGYVNCVVCATTRSQPEEPCYSEYTARSSKYTARSSKVLQTRDPDSWECPSCTFINNENNTNCDVCGTLNSSNKPSMKWKCDRCTFRNSLEVLSCLVCNEPRSQTYPAQQINNSNARVEKHSTLPIKVRTNGQDEGRMNHHNGTIDNGSHKIPSKTGTENTNSSPRREMTKFVHRQSEINDESKRTDETNTHGRPDRYKRKSETNIAHNTNMAVTQRAPEATTGKYRQDNRTPHTSNPDITRHFNGGGKTDRSQHYEINTSISPKSGAATPRKSIEGPRIGDRSPPERTDPKIPKNTEKSSPNRRDHRPEHRNESAGGAGPIKCANCNLDKKDRLVNEKGERINKCKTCGLCDAKARKCNFLNCFNSQCLSD